jgi:hypothetical protein
MANNLFVGELKVKFAGEMAIFSTERETRLLNFSGYQYGMHWKNSMLKI